MKLSSKSGIFSLLVVILGSMLHGCTARAASDGQPIDYLVQDVCLDVQGQPIEGDPATCARRRDLRVGEPQRYILTDLDRASGTTFQAASSVPVREADGHLMVAVIKNLEGSFTPDYRFTFSPLRDAFDLIDISHSGYASIVRTFDGGCFDQIFSRNGSRRTLEDRAGGWVLFPVGSVPDMWPAKSSLNLTTWRMQLTPGKAACADNQGAGVTSWEKPTLYTFETGKKLMAIRSDHFAAANLSQAENSFERNYFTTNYGLTRWEAWQTLAYCRKTLGKLNPGCRPADPANPWHSRCTLLKESMTGLAGVAHIGGQTWVRVACRDQTNYISLRRPQLFFSPELGQGFNVADIDPARTVNPGDVR